MANHPHRLRRPRRRRRPCPQAGMYAATTPRQNRRARALAKAAVWMLATLLAALTAPAALALALELISR